MQIKRKSVFSSYRRDMEEKSLKERKDMVLSLMNEKEYIPMKLKELAVLLNVPREERESLKEVLEALLAEGKISVSKKGKYAKAEIFAQTGIFAAHHRGFGFVTIEGRDGDVFVAPDNTGGAMDQDTVLVNVEEPRGGLRAEAVVVKVIERANTSVVGLYRKNSHFGFVIPDNPKITMDIFIPEGMDMGAVSGHKVTARLTSFGGPGKNPEGIITEIIGHVNDPGVDILSIVRAYGLPEGFPEDVMEETKAVPEELTEEVISGEIKRGRLDLRGIPMVTIDGEDAKDLDDAVSVSREIVDGRVMYHLGVHIADVTHYVREGSSLDKEALKRGTSVYLVDRVIPMLPHRLSNGICSLNAGCSRFALSCLMDLDERGNVVGHRIAESVVQIDRRMSYTEVNEILAKEEDEGSAAKETGSLTPMIFQMNEVAKALRGKRMARGAMDFDFPECKIILDEKGRPKEIKPYERNAATMLIEDFMLAANETVAEEYYWQQVPFLYRTHEKPDEEKIRKFGIFINNFGYSIHLQNGEIHPKEMQKLLSRVSGSPEEALLSRLALRSMKQAKYTTDCIGHFGLAARFYTHFTSPIRRYPDLQIHQIIKENLHGKLGEQRLSHYERILGEVSVWTSSRERLADEAERETDKAKKVQYMERRIGEVFEGVISGMNSYGFYVELSNTVEGMVRVSELDGDYYVFDEERYEMVGERTGKKYKLGQSIKIQVISVDRYLKTIDFLPVQEF